MTELPTSGVFGIGETVVISGSYSRALALALTQSFAGREVARWERAIRDVAALAGRNYEQRHAHATVSAGGLSSDRRALLDGSLVSTEDAGRLLGVSRSRVSQMVTARHLTPELLGRPNWFKTDDVLALKEKRDNQ